MVLKGFLLRRLLFSRFSGFVIRARALAGLQGHRDAAVTGAGVCLFRPALFPDALHPHVTGEIPQAGAPQFPLWLNRTEGKVLVRVKCLLRV